MPINFDMPDPSLAISRGINVGSALNQIKTQKLQQQQAADYQKQLQSDLSSVLAERNPTASDYASLVTKHPQFSEQFQDAWKMLNEEQKSNRTQQVSEIYSALESGSPDVAKSLLEIQQEAAKNSGNEREVKATQVMMDLIDRNPELARSATGMRLASIMGPEKFAETFTKLEQERREKSLDPSKLTKAQADARKAATEADFKESQIVGDLQKQGWDIYKIQEDTKVSKDNSKIAALNAQLKREQNQLKRDEMEVKLEELKRKRDETVQEKAANVESARGSIDNMINTLDRALQTPISVMDNATGPVDRMTPTFRQSTADFEELISTIDAQAFMAQIPSMKGLGALSDAEGKKLSAALQSFSLRQSTPRLVENLKEAQRLMFKARKNIADRYGVPESIPDTPASEPSPDEIEKILKQYGG